MILMVVFMVLYFGGLVLKLMVRVGEGEVVFVKFAAETEVDPAAPAAQMDSVSKGTQDLRVRAVANRAIMGIGVLFVLEFVDVHVRD